MKIVAFVDTLGFKQKISSINHQEAKLVIQTFNAEIYRLWKFMGYNHDNFIHGQTFSDSLIIYTENESNDSLRKVLSFLKELYKVSITICDLPLRGGISIGDFDRIPATEFDNLQKDLVVGTAFIDAYFLESANKIKGSKIVFRERIHQTIQQHLTEFNSKELVKLENGDILYEMPWGDIEFLTIKSDSALSKFISLATKSKWLDHYYHTLDTFLTKETQKDKHRIFNAILDKLSTDYKYHDKDNFIEKFLKTDGIVNLKKSFLSFIRERLEK